MVLICPPARAQTHSSPADAQRAPVRWLLVVDGALTPWPEVPAYGMDSLRAAARMAVRRFQREGYYLAHVDSVAVDTSAARRTVRLYVQRGPEVPVGAVRIRGNEAIETAELRRLMQTRPGRPLRPAVLKADLKAIVARYAEAGYPLAQVRIAEVRLTDGPSPRLRLTFAIDEGRSLRLARIVVEGAERTRPAYVAHVTGLAPGDRLGAYDPEILQGHLAATGLFEKVGAPQLFVTSDSTAVLRVALDEQSPGTFALALGYLPPSTSGESGRLVGSGRLALRNLFGGGRIFALSLERRPGRVSRLRARAADPFFLGWPLRVEAHFSGLQQDSTYSEQRYGLALGYRLREGFTVGLTLSREATRPGPAGARLEPSTSPDEAAFVQQIPRANTWFAGLQVRYRRVDDPVNPRRGFLLATTLEEGRSERIRRVQTAAGDTTLRRTTLRQERLRARVRFFIPTLREQSLVLGGEAAVLLSDTYALSDLFRLGGGASLRGYDEGRFRGSTVARLLAEYRYLIGRRSYAYVFFDLGYVKRPALDAQGPATRRVHPGYGVGIQFNTRLGLVNTSYALNPDDGFLNGRIHLRLAVGL